MAECSENTGKGIYLLVMIFCFDASTMPKYDMITPQSFVSVMQEDTTPIFVTELTAHQPTLYFLM